LRCRRPRIGQLPARDSISTGGHSHAVLAHS
jgi:hypothetical protein